MLAPEVGNGFLHTIGANVLFLATTAILAHIFTQRHSPNTKKCRNIGFNSDLLFEKNYAKSESHSCINILIWICEWYVCIQPCETHPVTENIFFLVALSLSYFILRAVITIKYRSYQRFSFQINIWQPYRTPTGKTRRQR